MTHHGHGEYLKCFEEALRETGFPSPGVRTFRIIPVARVVGSVGGRCHELDAAFLPLPPFRNKHTEDRLRAIVQALEAGQILPPIDVRGLGGEYYVLDGHRRVAAAKLLGQLDIDAEVTVYSLPEDLALLTLEQERAAFIAATELGGLELTEPGQYPKLQRQIEEHQWYLGEQAGQPVSLVEAAQAWRHTVYEPVAEAIAQAEIGRVFPERTTTDLFVYLCDHKWLESRRTGQDPGFSGALQQFIAWYRPPTVPETLAAALVDRLRELLGHLVGKGIRKSGNRVALIA